MLLPMLLFGHMQDDTAGIGGILQSMVTCCCEPFPAISNSFSRQGGHAGCHPSIVYIIYYV